MIFLSADELAIINNINKIRSTTCLNGMGNKTIKRVFLNGVNIAKLESVRLLQSRIGTYYIEATFSRNPEKINGVREVFADLIENVFFDKLTELCAAFGHELKPRPDNYPLLSYLSAVCKRLNTFKGREIKIAVRAYSDVVKDEYGKVGKMFVNGAFLDKEVTRTEILGYYPMDTEVEIDWNLWL